MPSFRRLDANTPMHVAQVAQFLPMHQHRWQRVGEGTLAVGRNDASDRSWHALHVAQVPHGMHHALAQGTSSAEDGILCASIDNLVLNVVQIEWLWFNRLLHPVSALV